MHIVLVPFSYTIWCVVCVAKWDDVCTVTSDLQATDPSARLKQASVYCSSSQVVKPIKITWDNKCKTELKCHSQQYSKIIKYWISLKYVLPRRCNQQAIDLLGHHAVSSNQIAHSPFSQYFEKYINRCGNNFLFSFINKNQDLTEKTQQYFIGYILGVYTVIIWQICLSDAINFCWKVSTELHFIVFHFSYNKINTIWHLLWKWYLLVKMSAFRQWPHDNIFMLWNDFLDIMLLYLYKQRET